MIGVHPQWPSCGCRLKVLMNSNSKPRHIGGPLEDSRRHLSFSFHQVVLSPIVLSTGGASQGPTWAMAPQQNEKLSIIHWYFQSMHGLLDKSPCTMVSTGTLGSIFLHLRLRVCDAWPLAAFSVSIYVPVLFSTYFILSPYVSFSSSSYYSHWLITFFVLSSWLGKVLIRFQRLY
jgi:hypothetical protein